MQGNVQFLNAHIQPNNQRQGDQESIALIVASRARKQAQRERERVFMTSVYVSRKQPDILFYCGLNEKYWNYHPVEPGEYVGIAPVTSITKEDKATGEKSRRLVRTQVRVDDAMVKHVLVDSGAFSDGIELKDGNVVKNNRFSFFGNNPSRRV